MSRIFVRNIPPQTKENDLKNLFEKVGKVADIVLKTNFAFIQYDSEKEAFHALKQLKDTSLFGSRLVLEIAKTRGEKLEERMNEKCFKCGDFGHWAKDCKTSKRLRREEKRKFKRIRRSPKRSFSRSLSRGSSCSRSNSVVRKRSRSRSRSRNK